MQSTEVKYRKHNKCIKKKNQTIDILLIIDKKLTINHVRILRYTFILSMIKKT